MNFKPFSKVGPGLVGIFLLKLKVAITGENPYKDLFRSNSKSPVQGKIFAQTQSLQCRGKLFAKLKVFSTWGNFRSNSKSPVQGKIFAQTQSLQYRGENAKKLENPKSPVQGGM